MMEKQKLILTVTLLSVLIVAVTLVIIDVSLLVADVIISLILYAFYATSPLGQKE